MTTRHFGLLVLLLLASGFAQARDDAAAGAERWDHLGCWNCHGSEGQGSRMAGTTIAKTPLPLRRFIGRVRLPIWQMPPHVPALAPDADLMTLYRWLGGSDGIVIPAAITIGLQYAPEDGAGDQTGSELELGVIIATVGTSVGPAARDLTALRYRVTLIANENVPAGPLEYRPAGGNVWSKATLDERGEALLAKEQRFAAIDAKEPMTTRARLRLPRPNVRTVVVLEALDYTQPARPVIVGTGSAVVKERQTSDHRLPAE